MGQYNSPMSDDERNVLDASLQEYQNRSIAAQAKAAQAYSWLLQLAQTRESGQIRYIARILASTYNGTAFPWNPFELRGLDVEIGDDMLASLDALRWGTRPNRVTRFAKCPKLKDKNSLREKILG